MSENCGETPQWRREIGNIPVELTATRVEVDEALEFAKGIPSINLEEEITKLKQQGFV